jgi:hypothetical protein
MVASMAWTVWCLYGLDYAFAYACFYDTSMGHYTWYLVPCNELFLWILGVSGPVQQTRGCVAWYQAIPGNTSQLLPMLTIPVEWSFSTGVGVLSHLIPSILLFTSEEPKRDLRTLMVVNALCRSLAT